MAKALADFVAEALQHVQEIPPEEAKRAQIMLNLFDRPGPGRGRSRRHFLKVGGMAAGGLSLPQLKEADIPLVRENTQATEVVLTARYQGCADRGICYPPQKTDFTLALPAASGAAVKGAASATAQPAGAAPATGVEA